VNIQPDNQDAQGQRYIRFQFWLSDHGQPGTMPYGIDLDEPIPEIHSDHETLREPARKPPLREKAPNPASALATAQRPPGSASRPFSSETAAPQRSAQAQIQQPEIPICVLPNPDLAKRSVRQRETERSTRLFSSICLWIALLVFLCLIGKFSSGSTASNRPFPSTTQIPNPAASSFVVVRRALAAVPRAVPVLTSDDKPVARAQLVVVPRAQLVRLP
jgi:hypothetical protein